MTMMVDDLPALDPDATVETPCFDTGDVLVACRDHDHGRQGCPGDLVVTAVYGRLVEFECSAEECRHAGSMVAASVPVIQRRAIEHREKMDRRIYS